MRQISVSARRHRLERRVSLAVVPAVPREGRRRRAVPRAGIVGVRPERGDLRRAERGDARFLLAFNERRERGSLPCAQQPARC